MNLTLPESLMLFALHDARGTIHHAAFMAIDHGLRGAVIGELKLRGHVQTRSNGEARHHPTPPAPPATPLLRDAASALAHAPSPGSVGQWMDRLSSVMPDLRARVLALLEGRGLLGREERDRAMLEDQRAFVARDASVEAAIRASVVAALDQDGAIRPREGLLVALTVACHLEQEVFGDRATDAVARAAWVCQRDAIARATAQAVKDAEGVE